MDKSKYKIGRVADLIGITPEALRYYEREGIIAPIKSEGSGYRYYSAWDVHILIRTRSFRQYGFKLEDTIKTLSDTDLENTVSYLKFKEEQLEEEIRKQQRLLDQLKHDRRAIDDARVNMGKFRVEYRPAMHFIDVQRGYDILGDKNDLYKQWIEKVPYVASGGVFGVDDRPEDLRYGLLIEDDFLDDIEDSMMGNTTPLPSCLCVTTFFQSGSDKELSTKMFEPSFKFLERKGLELAGDPVARAAFMKRREDGSYLSWYQGWIPFKGDIDYCLPIDD